MGTILLGTQASIAVAGTSGTGHFLYQLLDPSAGSIAPTDLRINTSAGEDNKTAIADTSLTFGNMRKEWSVDGSGRFPKATRKLGAGGLVTVSSGSAYSYRAQSFSLTFDWDEIDFTPLDVSALGSNAEKWLWKAPKQFVKVSGSWAGQTDTANVDMVPFSEGETIPGLTFRLEDAATDSTIALSAVTLTHDLTINANTGEPTTYGYSFVASGGITTAGSTPILSAATLAAQAFLDSSGIPTEILNIIAGPASANSKRYVGYAYLQSLTLNVDASGTIDVSWRARGSGPLTPSHS